MAIKLVQGFNITSSNPIDTRITMTKAEMLAVNVNTMPDKYICVCKDDGKLYIYDKSATLSETTGYFVPYEEKIDLPGAITAAMQTEEGKAAIENAVGLTLPGAIEEAMSDTESAKKIAEAMFDSEQFTTNVDNKVTLQVDKAIQCIEAIDGMA